MYTRIFSGPASRCVRSPGNRARQGDSDRKAGRREARTSATKKEVRGAGEASARLLDRPLYKRWRAHLSVSCDKKSGVPWDVPFLGLGRVIETMRALQKPVELWWVAASRSLARHCSLVTCHFLE